MSSHPQKLILHPDPLYLLLYEASGREEKDQKLLSSESLVG
jgi:hypothetical protein